MIKLKNIKMPVGSTPESIKAECARLLKTDADSLLDFSPSRMSVDARKKSQVHLVCSAVMRAENEKELIAALPAQTAELYSPVSYSFPAVVRKSRLPVVVVGMGPAGLFCALELAEAGLPVIILERGRPVEERVKDVERFWLSGELSESSNVQFGEGGAGAFSDGKLNTGINNPRVSHVLETFVRFGAPEDIQWSAKPHIGTDILREVVANIRKRLLELGCDIRFGHTLTGLKVSSGALQGIRVTSEAGSYEQACDALVLAPGHSARDTFQMLFDSGIELLQKPFAVGVRIEHLQSEISHSQYGDFCDKLPPADYKLSCHLPNGRGVYSFCVCPGGQVVAAASEQGRAVTNGMSLRARDGVNINGGFLVGVEPGDFGTKHPLGGVSFQRLWEERAFQLGGGGFIAPAQLVGDFLEKRPSKKAGAIEPSYRPGVRFGELDGCVPKFVSDSLRQALPVLNRQLKGFSKADAVMTGVETRSSSPVRILRDDSLQSNSVRGLYPCGEGAGYAGGITSAAVDGIRVAEAIAAEM